MQYGFTNYSHHAVHYIPITYLFYDWEFVPLNPFHLFHPYLNPSPLCQPSISFLYLWVSFPLLFWLYSLVCLLDPPYKWYHTVLVFFRLISLGISSAQFSHSVVSDCLWPHEPQHTRPPCPSPTPRVHSNSCPLNWWSHNTLQIHPCCYKWQNSFYDWVVFYYMEYML